MLRELERGGRPTVRVRLPVTDGARLAALYRDGEVLSREDHDSQYDVVVRLDAWQVDRLKSQGVDVTEQRRTREGRTENGLMADS